MPSVIKMREGGGSIPFSLSPPPPALSAEEEEEKEN
jgi:hypothetical protein